MDPKKLKIVLYPDPVLRRVARPIEQIDAEIRAVSQRMLELMHAAEGVGLAGPQIGLLWRLFVAKSGDESDQDMVFINPVLSDASREMDEHEEGCLSLPQVTGNICRPVSITIDALDLEGNRIHLTSEQISARIWQHETDHLDGRLILDRMSQIDKMANRRLLRDLEGERGRGGDRARG